MIRPLLIGASLALAAPAVAQTAAPTPDPARLKIATDIAGRLMPDGTYAKVMSGSMDKMMGSMTSSMLDIPVRSMARAGGLDEAKVRAIGPGTIRQVMLILDPAFEQRMQIVMKAMMAEIGSFVSTYEPDFRAGLAEAYANRFDAAQLNQIDAFFKTPTGALYASQSMLLQADPAVVARMQVIMPKMMERLPDIMGKAQAATAGLPKPRKVNELDPAEQAEVAKLLGIDPAKVK